MAANLGILDLSEIVEDEVIEYIKTKVASSFKGRVKEAITAMWESNENFPCDINFYYASELKSVEDTKNHMKAKKNTNCLTALYTFDPSPFLEMNLNRSRWSKSLVEQGSSQIT